MTIAEALAQIRAAADAIEASQVPAPSPVPVPPPAPVPVPAPAPVPVPVPAPAGVIALEDWSSMRQNKAGQPLFAPYLNAGTDYTGQTGSVVGREYVLSTPGRVYWHFQPAPYVDPTGFVRNYVRSGAVTSTTNRMYLRILKATGVSIPRKPGSSALAEVGTYFKGNDGDPAQQGDHRYHYLNPNVYPGRWILVGLSNKTQHRVGQNPGTNWPLIPNYFGQMTRFYFCDEYGTASTWKGTWAFGPITLATVTNEPDDLVSSWTAQYTGTRYEVSFEGPKKTLQLYDVTANGAASGTVQTRGDDYTNVFWASTAMPEAAEMVIQIRPQGQALVTTIRLVKAP